MLASAARFRLACLALATPFLVLACTERTPNYCDNHANTCGDNMTCNIDIHTCVTVGSDGGQDSVPPADANPDRPIDSPIDSAIDVASDVASDSPGLDAPRDTVVADRDDAVDVRTDGGFDTTPAEVHTGCNVNTDCTADPSKTVCIQRTGLCVGCLQNTDCKSPQAGVCDQPVTTCVQCLTSAQCTNPSTPICDAKVCRGCKVDSECASVGPGICMSHLDGRCASDDETVYVQNVPNLPGACSDTGPGSRTLPMCQSQAALDAVKLGRLPNTDGGTMVDSGTDAGADSGSAQKVVKDLVVMRGPAALTQWSVAAPGRVITVVGQAGAAIAPGGNIGIQVMDGTIHVHNLRISGGQSQPGVVASGGELHLDRCIVDTQMHGGLLIDGAAYEITNTVIADNGVTSTVGCGAWAGACIIHVPTGRPNRFVNNTMIGNGQVGVVCDAAYPILGSIVIVSTGGTETANCAFTSCCGAGAPNIDPVTYHLQAGSSCIDKLPAIMSTGYDIDGQSRPSGLLSDCGADEFYLPTP